MVNSLNGHLSSVKQTPRAGLCLSLLPFLSLYKTDVSLKWELYKSGPKCVHPGKS